MGPFIVIAQDSHPPFDVDAVALEEDTTLILSANVIIRETKEHVIRLMNDLYQYKEKTPGSLVVKGANPYRFLAGRSGSGVPYINFLSMQRIDIDSPGLQLLDTRCGLIKDKWFMERLRVILAETTNSRLKNLWLMIPDHCDPNKSSYGIAR